MYLEEEREKNSTATMFVSFDLVNCTLYKTRYKGAWVAGVRSILEYIMQAFTKESCGKYEFWKVLGDEVVYTKSIQKIEEISLVLSDVYRAVRSINDTIMSEQIGDATTAELMSVKATVWIADISPAHLGADNIYVEYQINEDEIKGEYLGTDIDEGFRIAKYTSTNRVVLSADLAALFWEEDALRKEFDKINFVAFRILKGIWNGEAYPIFMYHGDESVSFKDSITNETKEKPEILMDYLDQLPQRIVKASYGSYEEQLLSEMHEKKEVHKDVEQLRGILK